MCLLSPPNPTNAGHVALPPSRRNLGCLTLGFAEADPRRLAPSVGKTCALDHGSAAPIYIDNRRSVDFRRTYSSWVYHHLGFFKQLHQAHGENKKILERVTRRSTSTKALTHS